MRRGGLIGAALAGSAGGVMLAKKLWLAKYREQAAALAGAERERDLLYTWLLLKENGVELAEYFTAHHLQTIAILGMDQIGRRLCDDLREHAGLTVAYGVEANNLGAVHETLTVFRLGDDPLPQADCLVACGLERSQDEAELLRREFSGPVIPLTAVMSWLLERHHIQPRDGAIAGWPFEDAK